DYDAETGAKIQNQWGDDANHYISAHDLFLAMQTQKQGATEEQVKVQLNANIEQLAKDVAESPSDYGKKLELLRLRHDAGMSDQEFQKQLKEVALEAYKNQQKNGGNLNDPNFKRVEAEELYLLVKAVKDKDAQKAIFDEIDRQTNGELEKARQEELAKSS